MSKLPMDQLRQGAGAALEQFFHFEPQTASPERCPSKLLLQQKSFGLHDSVFPFSWKTPSHLRKWTGATT